MNDQKLKRRIDFLSYYAIVSSLAFIAIILWMYKNTGAKENYDELYVKRLNIVDETGENLRMVISNESRQHSGIIHGEKLPKRERPSGIIFFNSFGDECGGLVYDGNEKDAGMVLSIDKFKEDQIMQLQYMENTQNHNRKYGLQLWDYPKENAFKERNNEFKKIGMLESASEKKQAYQKMKSDSLLMADRLFIGKGFNKDVGLFIKDKNGNPRIKIYVDDNDNPKIELLDTEGKIIK